MNLPEVLAKYDLKEVSYSDYSYFHVWSFEPIFLWTYVYEEKIYSAKNVEFRFFYLLKGDDPSSSGCFCPNTWNPSNPDFDQPVSQFVSFLTKEEAEQEADELNVCLRQTLRQNIDFNRVAIRKLEEENRGYQSILEKLNQKEMK